MKAILVLFAVILVIAIVLVVIPELKVGMDAVQQIGGVLP